MINLYDNCFQFADAENASGLQLCNSASESYRVNVRENGRVIHKWTMQRHMKYCAHYPKRRRKTKQKQKLKKRPNKNGGLTEEDLNF